MPRGMASRAASIRAKPYARRVPRKRSKPIPRAPPDVTDLLPTRLDTKQMKGELPPFNDWGSFVVDHGNQKIYAYGGYRPNSETSTADFFSCDMATLKWKNLTHSLKFSHPYDPFSKDGINPKPHKLPRLHCAACTYLHLNGGNFIFLFGGHDVAKDRVTSDLIAIDVDSLTWWYVKVRGGPVNDRIHHSLVAIDNRIYVFGGKKEFDDGAPCFTSYSIAEYSSDDGVWSWVVCDHPYPLHVPSLGWGGKAIAVYDGTQILLTPGRIGGCDSTVDLSNNKLVFFHTEDHTFHIPATNSGDILPHQVSWYESFPVTALLDKPGHSPRKTGARTSIDPILSLMSPSIIFCTWLPRLDGYISLELWQYSLPPEGGISCLQLRDKLWDLDLDLQIFVAVGNRFFLLGYDAPPSARPDDAKFNICTEILLTGDVSP